MAKLFQSRHLLTQARHRQETRWTPNKGTVRCWWLGSSWMGRGEEGIFAQLFFGTREAEPVLRLPPRQESCWFNRVYARQNRQSKQGQHKSIRAWFTPDYIFIDKRFSSFHLVCFWLYSVTQCCKCSVLTSMVVLLMQQRGLLVEFLLFGFFFEINFDFTPFCLLACQNYDKPVVHYWPEFAQGHKPSSPKHSVTVGDVLRHQVVKS